MKTPHVSVFAPLRYHTVATLASSFPRCYSHRHRLCVCVLRVRVCAYWRRILLYAGRACYPYLWYNKSEWRRVLSRCGCSLGLTTAKPEKITTSTVARAPGIESRASWQVITGSLSAGSEPTRAIENPKKCHVFSIFFTSLCCCF